MSSQKKSWQNCETGAIEAMVSRGRDAHSSVNRRRMLGAIVAGSVGCVGAFVFASSRNSGKAPAPQIACDQVHKNLQDFVDNKIVDRYLRGMVSRHLFVCATCQQAYQGLIDGDDFKCGSESSADEEQA